MARAAPVARELPISDGAPSRVNLLSGGIDPLLEPPEVWASPLFGCKWEKDGKTLVVQEACDVVAPDWDAPAVTNFKDVDTVVFKEYSTVDGSISGSTVGGSIGGITVTFTSGGLVKGNIGKKSTVTFEGDDTSGVGGSVTDGTVTFKGKQSGVLGDVTRSTVTFEGDESGVRGTVIDSTVTFGGIDSSVIGDVIHSAVAFEGIDGSVRGKVIGCTVTYARQ
jgi:hypothetical protein